MPSASAVRAGRAYVELFAKQEQFRQQLKSALSRVSDFGKKAAELSKITMTMTFAGSLPIGRVVSDFAKFDDKLRIVQATTRATGQSFVRLEELARKLGRETSFTAQQVADGMVALGRAGLQSNEIENTLGAFLNLSRATATELPRAIEIATATMRGFNMQSTEAVHIADVLTATANASAQTLDDLGESFKYIVPISKEVGMTIKDTAKSVAFLANMGIKGSMAATGIRNILLRMSQTSVQELYRKELGVDVIEREGENAGGLRKLVDVMKDVGDAAKALPGAEQLRIFRELFGMYGMASGSAFASGVDFTDMFDRIENAEGTAERVAQEMDRGVGGAIRLTISKLRDIGLTLGQVLEPVILELRVKIEALATKVQSYIQEHGTGIRRLTRQIIEIISTIGAVIGRVARLSLYFHQLTSFVMGLAATAPHIYVFAKALKAVTETTRFLVKKWEQLNTFIQKMIKMPKVAETFNKVNDSILRTSNERAKALDFISKRQAKLNDLKTKENDLQSVSNDLFNEAAKYNKKISKAQSTLDMARRFGNADDIAEWEKKVSDLEAKRDKIVAKMENTENKIVDSQKKSSVIDNEIKATQATVKNTDAILKNTEADKKRLAQLLKTKAAYAALAAGIVFATVAVTALIVSLIKQAQAQRDIKKIIEDQNKKNEIEKDIIEKKGEKAKSQLDRLTELNNIENKTNAQQEEMKTLVEALTRSYGDLGIKFDETTGKIKDLAQAYEVLEEKQRQQQRRNLMDRKQNAETLKIQRESKAQQLIEEDIARRRAAAARASAGAGANAAKVYEQVFNQSGGYDEKGVYHFSKEKFQAGYEAAMAEVKEQQFIIDDLQDQINAIDIASKEAKEVKENPVERAKVNIETAQEQIKEYEKELFGSPARTVKNVYDDYVDKLSAILENSLDANSIKADYKKNILDTLQNNGDIESIIRSFEAVAKDETKDEKRRQASQNVADAIRSYINNLNRADAVLNRFNLANDLTDIQTANAEAIRIDQDIANWRTLQLLYYKEWATLTQEQRESLKKQIDDAKKLALQDTLGYDQEALSQLQEKESEARQRLADARIAGIEEDIKAAQSVIDSIIQAREQIESKINSTINELESFDPKADLNKFQTRLGMGTREVADMFAGSSWTQKLYQLNSQSQRNDREFYKVTKQQLETVNYFLGLDANGEWM